ncbi:uncharacterized protein LOC128034812 [Gossypium raimondii]|uniref:uncharacterized protein LOC128034812 n=1 Tax=Gossypium raimondii TaxID=29730 RepID=UPI00227AF493|nr:uncharacterized protein LOC128034812 [Gossypium raimondii]
MCKRFEDGLNQDIKLLVGILELKEFVVLVDRPRKAEEISKEKRNAEIEAIDSRKRLTEKSYQDCPEKSEKDNIQTSRPNNIATRGRIPCNPRNVSGNCGVMKDSTVRFEARTPTRAYAILACGDAAALDVITGTFSLVDTNVTALIDPGSTHLYVCTNLVSSKNLPLESIELSVNDSGQKHIILKCQNGKMLHIESDKLSGLLIVISTMSTKKYVRKGCNAYLTYVLDTKVSDSKLESVSVVCEYPGVFPEELPGLP